MERSSLNRRIIREKVNQLQKLTHFNADQIEKLLRLHEKVASPNRNIKKDKFRNFLCDEFKMTSDLLLSRVCEVFDPETRGGVCDVDFVKGMSVFIGGNLMEKIEFVFACYDLNKDGYLTKDDIFPFVKTDNSGLSLDEEDGEAIKDLSDIVLKKMDVDLDNRISLSDYKKSVEQDSLLLEVLGDCFPSDKQKQIFWNMLKE